MSARTSPLGMIEGPKPLRSSASVHVGELDGQSGLGRDAVEARLPVLDPVTGALGRNHDHKLRVGLQQLGHLGDDAAGGTAINRYSAEVAEDGANGPSNISRLPNHFMCTSFRRAVATIAKKSQLLV